LTQGFRLITCHDKSKSISLPKLGFIPLPQMEGIRDWPKFNIATHGMDGASTLC
jgi:hypothetical protein